VSPMFPTVSVIVPVFNAERALPRLMDSLRAQTYPRDCIEIILVDNNSTDRSPEVMRRYPEAIPLAFAEWQSSYAARNVGIQRATGEVLAFIDADCRAHPDWLRAGVSALIDKGADRIAGEVKFALPACPNTYERYDSACHFKMGEYVRRGWSGAGNLFVRRGVMETVGMFDPRLISGGDYEFGIRATRAGKTLAFASNAVVYHGARRSFRSLVKKKIRVQYGAAQVYRRHGLLDRVSWRRLRNYRPILGQWSHFPADVHGNARMRLFIDVFSNVLQWAGNAGNLAGCLATPSVRGPAEIPFPPRASDDSKGG